MALLTVKSTNPNFSFVTCKNPATGMLVKEIRLGKAFGWFSQDNQCYNIYFKDAPTEVSYKSHPDEDFEYVNTTRFNSAMFPINALTEYLKTTFKKAQEHDVVGFSNELVINLMFIKNPKYIDIFKQHFGPLGFEMEAIEVAPKNYKVIVQTKRSVRDLLNYVNLFCVFNVLKNDADWFDVSDDVVQKYMECLSSIDAPYFVRYVFKVNLLRNKKIFEKYKKVLETTALYDKLVMTVGNSAIGRRNMVKEHLGDLQNNILDVGCGEGFFVFDMARDLARKGDRQYLAVDTNPEILSEVAAKAERKEIENLHTFLNLDDIPAQDLSEKTDVLMVEVIEHMPLADAEKLVASVLKRVNFQRLIITTPNRDFNQFFSDEEGHMRHDDHHWEMNRSEFVAWIAERLGQTTAIARIIDVGDSVNGIYMTTGVLIEPTETQEMAV